MFNRNGVRGGNGDGESGILSQGSSLTVDQIFEYSLGMIPIGQKQQRKNQVHFAPESPRRKRKEPSDSVAEAKNERYMDTYTDADGDSEMLTLEETVELYYALTEHQMEETEEEDFAFDVLLPLLEKGEVDLDIAKVIVERAHEEFVKESLLIDLDFDEGVETVVVGDIHGQFRDLLLIFKKFGRPGERKRYIFNGDIVDRGPRSVACWLFICALKISCPQYLFVTRGNHESRTVNIFTSSFASECVNNYSEDFFSQCQRTFNELPLSYVLNKTIFVTHGGLPRDLCLNKMRKLPKSPLHPNFDMITFMALLWNDPTPQRGYAANSRGPRVFSFGPDITEKFLQKHNLSLLIRSHEYQVFGHQYTHNSKCLTIFSSPDYQKLGNTGAVALVDSKGHVKVEQFYE